MNDHVTQPMAARLQAAGWPQKPTWVFPDGEEVYSEPTTPSIGELRERLTWNDFKVYYKRYEGVLYDWEVYAQWLYAVTASADLQAEVWLFTQGKEGK